MPNEYVRLRAEIAQLGAPKDVLFAVNDLHTMRCVHRFYTNQPQVLQLMEVQVRDRKELVQEAA